MVDILVDHVDFPFRTVEHESNGPHAPIIGIAYVDEFDDGLHAFIQSDRDFFVFCHAKEEGRCIKDADIPIFLDEFLIVLEYLGILAVGVHIFIGVVVLSIFELCPDGFKINGVKEGTRTLIKGLPAFEDDLLQLFRESLVGHA